MSRINIVLLLALLLSSLWLVRTSYDARRLFAEIDRARSQQERLDADYRRLDAERQTQATHLRVERMARDKLGMRAATPAVTEHVNDPAAASSALAPATPPGAAGTSHGGGSLAAPAGPASKAPGGPR